MTLRRAPNDSRRHWAHGSSLSCSARADGAVNGIPDSEWTIDVAVVNVGAYNIELIRPVSGAVDLYREAVRPCPATFHHVGVEIDSLAEVGEVATRAGRDWSLIGHTSGFAHFVYLDLREELFHFVEFIELEAKGKPTSPN
jgi:hypothetical protein